MKNVMKGLPKWGVSLLFALVFQMNMYMTAEAENPERVSCLRVLSCGTVRTDLPDGLAAGAAEAAEVPACRWNDLPLERQESLLERPAPETAEAVKVPDCRWSDLPLERREFLLERLAPETAEAVKRQPAGSRAVQDLLDRISRYCSASVQYRFGSETEVLDGDTVVSWIQYEPVTSTIYLDRSRIEEYIAGLAEKYDTYQKPREFLTSAGDTVTVTGGSYGWLLDQAREAEVLEHLIRSGAKRIRTPRFAHTAAGWSHSDLGDTYVEIDLTNQHVWLYVDGVQELSTECVSGTYMDSGRRTPAGTYTIYSVESPAVLTGPDWNSPVSYWMPFNGGIGLHDATWRSSFGGDIFLYSGSHGCINLPLGAAEVLYRYAYSGMPVICYYR